ncbi:MAG: elongation factor G [Caldilineae bacterium]|nr:elongation factor G [Chloroflexota bacterium]MCB9175928.1 elongation factor G [Caldilineae bacterium]
MKEYSTDKIHNVAIVGHSGAGKTAIAEAALYATKVITRMGKTEEGNTVSDFHEEEHRRSISISSSLIPVEWEGYKINFIDTPGYADFVGEVMAALKAVDCALVVVDSVAGVEVGTEIAWQYLDELNLPRMVVINKMDRDNANWTRVMGELREAFPDTRFAPLQLPIGKADAFKGIYRLNTGTTSLGPEGKPGEAPAEILAEADDYREALVEAAAESDDALMMKYFDEGDLTPDEVREGLLAGGRKNAYVPVLFTAATDCIGIHALLGSIKLLAPSPAESVSRTAIDKRSNETVELVTEDGGPLVLRIFKTQADPYVGKLQYLRVISGSFQADSRVLNVNHNEEERVGPLYVLRGKEQITVGHLHAGDIGAVAKLHHSQTGDTLADKEHPFELRPFVYPQPLYSVAVVPSSQADGAKLGQALHKIVEEDPTLQSHFEDATHELILSGMGNAHIDVAVHHLEEKYGVHVHTATPRIPYRETVTRKASAQYRHKKQTGGAGQFAEVHLRLEPLESGSGFEYASEVFGGAISSQFISSIEKGVRQMLQEGVIAHCPVVDVRAVVYDGKEHPVDSKDIAFQIAGREAFKKAMQDAGPTLLEPILNVRVIVPNSQMGDVLGDLNTRRGMVQGTEQIAGKAVVSAHVPLAEMQRYSTDLRSMTQGRGYYTAEFSHFAPVPQQLMPGIIAQVQKVAEEEH